MSGEQAVREARVGFQRAVRQQRSQKLLPAKTRAFVDYVTAGFREENLARRFSAEE